ncbi:MAG: ATP citrate lyase citrate-binding domain-containing protein [bacterium]|nr:ATP citrate lyase citrate-binding domain-containing protein [bacterium]MDZ4299963.1 ATP-grasp domain-containing protein [Candidatus Sungbacteria bacterium]
MKLYEYEGKELFKKYNIPVPKGVVVSRGEEVPDGDEPVFLKAQVKSGDRKKEGGILEAKNHAAAMKGAWELLDKKIKGEQVEKVLVEERVDAAKEYYVSFSYDSDYRAPVLSVSTKGGSGIAKAHIVPVDMLWGVPNFFLRDALTAAGFPQEDIAGVSRVAQSSYSLFIKEYALLAEMNPLFKTKDGAFVAGDAKIILDDEKYNPGERRFLDMDGDIAVLASGGGASLLNMDALLRCGGRPANYTEYSGNPKSDVVKELTKRVLSRPGLKGCWVVGGTANFTDIYETLKGFLDGLRGVTPKPNYPIVIRRDGPRRAEAFAMLKEVSEKEGYDFHLFGSDTAMADTAKIMVREAYGKKKRSPRGSQKTA